MASKRDYIKIAETIKDAPANDTWREHLATSIADVFMADNSRFDRYVFYRACGLEELATRLAANHSS